MILTVAGTLAGLMLLAMALSALLPVLVLKRIAAARGGERAGTSVLEGHSPLSAAAGLLLPEAPSPARTEADPGGSLEHFERRLLELERRVAQPQTIGKAVRAAARPFSSPAVPELPAIKPAKAARVAITAGAREAITFLPAEAGLPKVHA